MASPFDKAGHLDSSLERQRMMGESWPGTDVCRHYRDTFELAIRRFREQRNRQVFQRNHADAKLDNLGIRQFGRPRPELL
jgi:hypothetical protein